MTEERHLSVRRVGFRRCDVYVSVRQSCFKYWGCKYKYKYKYLGALTVHMYSVMNSKDSAKTVAKHCFVVKVQLITLPTEKEMMLSVI